MRVVLLVWLTIASAGARADDASRTPEPVSFGRLDSDSNGYVSRVEARSIVVVESGFDAADSNGDGLLDRDEYRSLHRRAASD